MSYFKTIKSSLLVFICSLLTITQLLTAEEEFPTRYIQVNQVQAFCGWPPICPTPETPVWLTIYFNNGWRMCSIMPLISVFEGQTIGIQSIEGDRVVSLIFYDKNGEELLRETCKFLLSQDEWEVYGGESMLKFIMPSVF